MASLPLHFSSSSWWACLKGSLKKFFLSFSFRFPRLLILLPRRSLASLCLRSSYNSLRPSFSSGAVFLHLFFRWRLSDMSNSMCLSLCPFCLGAMVCLDIHSPNLSLHSSYMMFPVKVSLCSTVPRKEYCSSPLRCSSSLHQTSCILAFGHLILVRLSGCLRWLPGCVTCEGTVRILLSRLASSSLSSAEVALSALSCPAALWFATRLWVPSVWPAEAVRLCRLGVFPHFILPWCIRKPLSDVTFCHPHVHFQRDFSLPLSVPFVTGWSVKVGPSSTPPLGGPSGCLFLFRFVVIWGAPLWEACG